MHRIVSQEEVEALLCGLCVDETRIADKSNVEAEATAAAVLPLSRQKVDPTWLQSLLHQVETLAVEARIELGDTTLNATALRRFQVGDLIHLDQTQHSEALVKIEGISKFKGIPRRIGQQKGLKITATIQSVVVEQAAPKERLIVEFARTHLLVLDLLRLCCGSVIELSGPIAEPLDIFVRGILVARGNMVVLDEHLGVRATQLADGIGLYPLPSGAAVDRLAAGLCYRPDWPV